MADRDGQGREALDEKVLLVGPWSCCDHCADDQPHIEANTHEIPCQVCVYDEVIRRATMAHDAEVAAGVLREAADDFYPGPSAGLGGGSGFVRDYLRARADEGNPR